MKLTDDEKSMLDGNEGKATQKAMELLVKYGEALGAERFVDTNNVTLLTGLFMYPEVVRNTVSNFDMDEIASKFFLDSDEIVHVITGYMTVPLMMLSLGIYYNPKAFMNLPVFSAVFIRMGIGLFLGFIFVYLFNLKGISKEVVLVISSAPSGISTLVFSSMEGLDNEFAASIVSYSVLAGIFIVPIVLHFSS